MNRNILRNTGLLILAVIFSTGLIFAFIELPDLIDRLVQQRFGFPQFDQGEGAINAMKTEIYIQGLHLRWIGYGSLLLILLLIIFGYTTKRSGWALAGAVGLFIPVFGQFALSMFFLAGLGFLRVGWLPFLEVNSFQVLDLGKVIYVPYWILKWLFGLFHWNAHTFLSFLFMGSGAFLFTWGVLVWFRSRYERSRVASQWIYRISRHPQYLGWILWSYGFMLFTPEAATQFKKSWTVPSSLPWLLMTMTIVGICMMEEIKMMKVTAGGYQEYRRSAPFLFPLPRFFNRIITYPARLISGDSYPERAGQVFRIVILYTVILILLSLIWVDFGNRERSDTGTPEAREELGMLLSEVRSLGDNRREIYAIIEKVPLFGKAGLDSLEILADDPNPHIREFSIQLLGEHGVADAEEIFLTGLHDSIRRVRSAAIIASGEIKSKRASDSLVSILQHPPVENNLFHIYGVLGSIGDPDAIPVIARGLGNTEWFNQTSALNAIMEIDPEAGTRYAIAELRDDDVNVRRNAVINCILSGDPSVVEPLSSLLDDEDFEVRFYAKQGIRILKKQKGIPGSD